MCDAVVWELRNWLFVWSFKFSELSRPSGSNWFRVSTTAVSTRFAAFGLLPFFPWIIHSSEFSWWTSFLLEWVGPIVCSKVYLLSELSLVASRVLLNLVLDCVVVSYRRALSTLCWTSCPMPTGEAFLGVRFVSVCGKPFAVLSLWCRTLVMVTHRFRATFCRWNVDLTLRRRVKSLLCRLSFCRPPHFLGLFPDHCSAAVTELYHLHSLSREKVGERHLDISF